MSKSAGISACLAACVAMAGWECGTRNSLALNLIGVMPAALDQPQINAVVYVGNNTIPQIGETQDPLGGVFGDPETVRFFNVQTYLDTGASSILLSSPTATELNLPLAYVGNTPVLYTDVGVAGSDNFQVSQQIRLALANFYPRTDLDQFSDTNQTIPITTPYTPLPPPSTNVRIEVGPYVPTVDNPGLDDIDQLIQELTQEENAVDVIGMPAIRNHVMVLDPTAVKDVGQLYSILGNILSGSGDITDLSDADLNQLETAGLHTFLYAPGTAYHPSTLDTDPGIPKTQLHVKLSYASFDRFTTVTPSGQPGPTLVHNPIIGQDPVRLLDGVTQPGVPGIKISRTMTVQTPQGPVQQTLSSEGNWLLDTGAAASIISQAQAAKVGVTYKSGTFGTDSPVLVDQNGSVLPDQFTLVLGGIGGQSTLAGFFLDSLLLRTMEGAGNDLDPHNLTFTDAPVLVGDVTVKDPVTGQTLTLDGIFGMNFLIQSINIATDGAGNLTDISDPSPSFFRWVTFDEPNGILGLTLDQTADAQSASWSGGTGNWSSAAKWSSNPVIPNNDAVTVSGYDVTIGSGVVTLDVNATIDTLMLTGGSLTGAPGVNLTLTGGTVTGSYNVLGTTTLAGGTLLFSTGAQHAGVITGTGGLVVDTGATLTSKGITLDELTVNGAATIAAGSGNAGTSKVSSLVIAGNGSTFTGKLNLSDNKLIVQATDSSDKGMKIAAINSAISAGASGGTWAGNGITSSTAAGDAAHYGVGVFDNAILNLASFGGDVVDANSVLVALTHLGDANANGVVDIQDQSIITNNWQKPGNNWAAGDLNGDGFVDIQDLTIVTNNWQQSSAFSQGDGSAGGAAVSVPEPASVILLGLAALGLGRGRGLRRGNRRQGRPVPVDHQKKVIISCQVGFSG